MFSRPPRAPPSSPASNTARTRVIRRSALLVRMRSRVRPPAISATRGAMASAMVLTALAPMASRTSTTRCSTTYVPRGRRDAAGRRCRVRRRRTATSAGSCSLASAMQLVAVPRAAAAGRPRDRRRRGPGPAPASAAGSIEVRKPPWSRAIRARLAPPRRRAAPRWPSAPGSSRPLTMKFVATPTGMPITPTAFSIMWSAWSTVSPVAGSRTSSRARPRRSRPSTTASRRSSTVRSLKPEMRLLTSCVLLRGVGATARESRRTPLGERGQALRARRARERLLAEQRPRRGRRRPWGMSPS